MSVAWVCRFPAITMALLAAGGLYRDRLRLQLLDDLRTIAGATAIASMATIALPVLLGAESTGLPRRECGSGCSRRLPDCEPRRDHLVVIASRRHSAAVPTLIVGRDSRPLDRQAARRTS
jgi:hypothetical protein